MHLPSDLSVANRCEAGGSCCCCCRLIFCPGSVSKQGRAPAEERGSALGISFFLARGTIAARRAKSRGLFGHRHLGEVAQLGAWHEAWSWVRCVAGCRESARQKFVSRGRACGSATSIGASTLRSALTGAELSARIDGCGYLGAPRATRVLSCTLERGRSTSLPSALTSAPPGVTSWLKAKGRTTPPEPPS